MVRPSSFRLFSFFSAPAGIGRNKREKTKKGTAAEHTRRAIGRPLSEVGPTLRAGPTLRLRLAGIFHRVAEAVRLSRPGCGETLTRSATTVRWTGHSGCVAIGPPRSSSGLVFPMRSRVGVKRQRDLTFGHAFAALMRGYPFGCGLEPRRDFSVLETVARWRRGAHTPRDFASKTPARAVRAPRLHTNELPTLCRIAGTLPPGAPLPPPPP
jgi:hypothetical protein